ncbi:MAG: hypothetical protein PF442_03120 [Desulfobulbaceae bacterium]|jgi:di/tricarboxylate transporter|nr:hypothetical protein [Desulfobulbaceae bacterium]
MDTLVNNVASSVFIFPIALTVLAGALRSFISPVGYQTNLMVYGPDKYTFIDYVKIGVPLTGVPLTIVVGIVMVLPVPLFFLFK